SAATVMAVIMHWIRFPGGLLFGAMAASAVLHGGDFLHASLPWWLGSCAVVVLGGVVGARFANTTPAMLLDYFWAGLGSAAVAIAVSSIFVLLVVNFLPFRASDVVIAFAPGAQDTMMVLALALQLDPVYVGAHHLTRFLIVTFTVALAARRLARRRVLPPAEPRKRPMFDDSSGNRRPVRSREAGSQGPVYRIVGCAGPRLRGDERMDVDARLITQSAGCCCRARPGSSARSRCAATPARLAANAAPSGRAQLRYRP